METIQSKDKEGRTWVATLAFAPAGCLAAYTERCALDVSAQGIACPRGLCVDAGPGCVITRWSETAGTRSDIPALWYVQVAMESEAQRSTTVPAAPGLGTPSTLGTPSQPCGAVTARPAKGQALDWALVAAGVAVLPTLAKEIASAIREPWKSAMLLNAAGSWPGSHITHGSVPVPNPVVADREMAQYLARRSAAELALLSPSFLGMLAVWDFEQAAEQVLRGWIASTQAERFKDGDSRVIGAPCEKGGRCPFTPSASRLEALKFVRTSSRYPMLDTFLAAGAGRLHELPLTIERMKLLNLAVRLTGAMVLGSTDSLLDNPTFTREMLATLELHCHRDRILRDLAFAVGGRGRLPEYVPSAENIQEGLRASPFKVSPCRSLV
jgi:hypothetical protein